MIRISIILLLISFNMRLSFSQNVFIKGYINSNSFEKIRIYKEGVQELKPGINDNIIATFSVKNNTFSGVIQDLVPGFYKLGDGFYGHIMYLSPGDSVEMTLLKKQKSEIPMESSQYLTVISKFPYNYLFFDSLSSFFGHYIYPIDRIPFNDILYRKSCDSAYTAALDLLELYHSEKLISDSCFKYTNGELRSKYIIWLCQPLWDYSKDAFQKNYFENINNFKFNDDSMLSKTSSYVQAVEEYILFILNDFNPKDQFSNFGNVFYSASHNFTGLLRDKLMGWVIENNIGKGNLLFDSLYNYFSRECNNQLIRNDVTKKLKTYQVKSNNLKLPFDSILIETSLNDFAGKNYSLKFIPGNKKLLLIDLWASWCKPCIREFPFMKKFEEKYKDSIDFIFLSIDAVTDNWKNYITKNFKGQPNHYLLKDGVQSKFADYFELGPIPRYILIDRKNNSVIYKDLPFPDEDGFEEALQKGLKME